MNHISPISELGTAVGRCRHCGNLLSDGAVGQEFCCRGCAAAYDLIQGLGLSLYYRRRTLDPAAAPPKPDEQAAAVDLEPFVNTDSRGVHHLYLMVDGLQCAACVWLIESVLSRQPDLVAGRVNMTTRRLHLAWKGDVGRGSELASLVGRLGYRTVPYDPSCLATTRSSTDRMLLRSLAVAGFAAANVMLLSVSVWSGNDSMGPATRDLMHWLSALIALPAIAYSGRPFFKSAAKALRAGRTNMDVPISIGVLLTAGMSLIQTINSAPEAYFDSAIALLFFLLIGRYLDERARGQARGAAEHLMTLQTGTVNELQQDGTLRPVSPATLQAGSRVLVSVGERIGVDGTVAEGRSDVDMSLVTGETVPASVMAGSPVFTGTINLSAPLTVLVTATGEGTLLAEIVRLMEAAERGRGRFVTMADRIARYYAPVVHTTAFLTFVGWMLIGGLTWQPALLIAVSVLVVTCPCAIALAVPVTQVVAHGRLIRRGILVKSPTALERLRDVDTVVFDKTGTLTVGRPELIGDPTLDPAIVLAAARLAASSRHPLARALARAAGTPSPADGVQEHPGQGLSLATPDGEQRLGNREFVGIGDGPATREPELWFAVPGRSSVQFRFSDKPRADAAGVVERLRRAKLDVRLLSGDRLASVAPLAALLGIKEFRAEMTPAMKVERLGELSHEGRHVLMVGDGLNDAPALAAASVSASPATAVDIAQTAADVVFQGERLEPVREMLWIARQAGRIMRQNIGFALVYNAVAVPLAIAGGLTPLIAAVAMSGSSLIVIVNALRLNWVGEW